MKKSTRVLVIGPLAPYAAGYRASWMAGLLALDRGVVSVLVREAEPLAGRAGARPRGPGRRVCRSVRRRPARRPRGCGAAGDPARDVLAAGLPAAGGAAPAPAVVGTDVGGREALVNEFAWFLRTERGLAETTIDWYRHVAAMFLSAAGRRRDGPGCAERPAGQRVRAGPDRAPRHRLVEQRGDRTAGAAALLLPARLHGHAAGRRRAPHRGVAGQGPVARARPPSRWRGCWPAATGAPAAGAATSPS